MAYGCAGNDSNKSEPPVPSIEIKDSPTGRATSTDKAQSLPDDADIVKQQLDLLDKSSNLQGIVYYPGARIDELGSVDIVEDKREYHRREMTTEHSVEIVEKFYKEVYPEAVASISERHIALILPDGELDRKVVIFPDPIDKSKTAIKLIADSINN